MPLQPSPAVLRAGHLLRLLAEHPASPRTVSELARQAGVPRATCDTLLRALAETELVRRDEALRYELGPACIALGDAARVANPALRAAAHEAEALARELRAFALVSIRDGGEVRVVSVFDFGPPLGLRARVGEAIQLVPPFGASFVAWSDPGAQDHWLEQADPPLDDAEERAYRDALDAVRRRGYSVTVSTARQANLIEALERLAEQENPEEARRARDEAVRQMTHSEHLTGDLDPDATLRVAQVSAPVFDPAGQVAAAIMLLGPSHELTTEEIDVIGRRVASAAAAATDATGGGRR